MNQKTKLLGIGTMLCAALFLTLSASLAGAGTTRAANGPTVTKIRVNGLSADTFLTDGDTMGGLNVGRDQIADTTALDFSYATPDAEDPDIVILIQGSGEIPNSAFTISRATAHLAVTTPFPITRCVVNIVTADFTCDPGDPITFDLTWVKNGFGSIHMKIQQTETFGPVTTKSNGEYESVTAAVNGTWTGHSASDMLGNLVDSKNKTNFREVTVEANP